jgi:membrane protease YdiL (CAAX protease family)
VNPDVPTHWVLPPDSNPEASWRLFIGINLVGIWDELFFVNTVYAVLRSIFPYRVANAGQAVVYSAVLTRMAFTGFGPILVFIFAVTQGAMFEDSDNLLYVILVHLIVDAFLFAAILSHYYSGYSLFPF